MSAIDHDAARDRWLLPRRELLKQLATGVAAGTLLAGWRRGRAQAPQSGVDDELFWAQVANQFPIRPGLIVMNAANLCPTHYSVLDSLYGLNRGLDADVSFQHRAAFGDTHTRSKNLLAEYLGAGPDEIAITRNTSEGNNFIVNGLDLGPGDEVVIWDENHPSNNVAWDVRAARHGFSVRRVPTPESAGSAEDLRRHFVDALSARTRVFAASHVSNVSGIGLPVADIGRECRTRGILTLIDGAQTFGALDLNLPALGCDFFTGSLHKWPMGPKETGLLYVRRGLAERVWPSVVSVDYEAARDQGAAKFEDLGQRSDPVVAAVAAAIEFNHAIGAARVEARLRAIMSRLRAGIETIPKVSILTPADSAISAGILIFGIEGRGGRDIFEALYRSHGIVAAPNGLIDGVRLSPHIYNSMADVDAAIAAVRAVAS